jgi:hypothetical protein
MCVVLATSKGQRVFTFRVPVVVAFILRWLSSPPSPSPPFHALTTDI